MRCGGCRTWVLYVALFKPVTIVWHHAVSRAKTEKVIQNTCLLRTFWHVSDQSCPNL